MKRKPLSKKIRFEVFKRDKFTCQYCGGKAPDIVLHVDHIDPVAEGGTNDIFNLVTSCSSCNWGKGKIKLSDDAVVEKRRRQLEDSQGRLEQLEMMYMWQRDLLVATNVEFEMASSYIMEACNRCDDWNLSDVGARKVRTLIENFGIQGVMEGIRIAKNRYLLFKDNKATDESFELFFGKIGGICYNRKNNK